MKLSRQRIDASRAAGVWVDIDVEGETIRIKIASFNNTDYQNALEREKTQWMIAERRKGRKPTEEDWKNKGLDKVLPKLMAEHILLDWAGIEGEAGKPQPYDVKLAEEMCNPKIFPKLAWAILSAAMDTDNFLQETLSEEVEEVKNG